MELTNTEFNPLRCLRDTMSSTVRAFLSSFVMQSKVETIAREYPIDFIDDFVSAKDQERFLRQWAIAARSSEVERSLGVSWGTIIQHAILPKSTIDVMSNVPLRRFATDVLTSAYTGGAHHLIYRMRDIVQMIPCHDDGFKNNSWGYFLSEMHSAICADALKNPEGLTLRRVIARNVNWKTWVAQEDHMITIPLAIKGQVMMINLRAVDFIESDPRKNIEIRLTDEPHTTEASIVFGPHELRQHIFNLYQKRVDVKQDTDILRRNGVMKNTDHSMTLQPNFF